MFFFSALLPDATLSAYELLRSVPVDQQRAKMAFLPAPYRELAPAVDTAMTHSYFHPEEDALIVSAKRAAPCLMRGCLLGRRIACCATLAA